MVEAMTSEKLDAFADPCNWDKDRKRDPRRRPSAVQKAVEAELASQELAARCEAEDPGSCATGVGWVLGAPTIDCVFGKYEVILFGNRDIVRLLTGRLNGEPAVWWESDGEAGPISDIEAYRGPLPSASSLLSLLRAQADRENDDE